MMGWALSLLVPIAYLSILLTSLATFSHLYRQRKLRAKQSLAPYFPPHTARNIYLSLLRVQDFDASSPKVPDSVVRAALLARAVEDIRRLVEIRSRKAPLQQLLQRGLVGDEIWQRFLRAEQEMEIELKDVVSEANALSGGTWGQVIFQSAGELHGNALLKKKLEAIKATVPEEKDKWQATRQQARRELEDEVSSPPAPPTTSTPAAAVSTATRMTSTVEKTARGISSDEDTVLVETPADGQASMAGAGAKNKKKKGKKQGGGGSIS